MIRHFPTSFWLLVVALASYAVTPFLKYVVVPIKVRRGHWRPVDPHFISQPLSVWPNELQHAVIKDVRFLAAEGFVAVEYLTHDPVPPGRIAGFVSIWFDQSHDDLAEIVGVHSRSRIGRIKVVNAISVSRRFTDGTRCITSNTRSPGIFPTDPQADAVVISSVDDLRKLIAVHRLRVNDLQGNRVVAGLSISAEQDRLSEWQRTFNRLVTAGYYRLNADKDRYEPTWRGAFTMTWRMLWPLKQWPRWRRHVEGDRVLRAYSR